MEKFRSVVMPEVLNESFSKAVGTLSPVSKDFLCNSIQRAINTLEHLAVNHEVARNIADLETCKVILERMNAA